MATREIHKGASPTTATLPAEERRARKPWLAALYSPLWLCLLLALAVRIWLLIHTHGFIDGDESVVGIQAQNILHGERPVYYYGQPYMGSMEAYLVALLFALFGPSTWAMRGEAILLSLVVVWLTWKLAGALADTAKLSARSKRWFMLCAGLLAALPPLYDAMMEMRVWGGHIETYVLMLSLLYVALRLTQRWQAGASLRELALRWALIGFLIGLGCWIYPLVITAILAVSCWIGGFFIIELVKARRSDRAESQYRSVGGTVQRLALALVALPASLIGFAPGIYWGAQNNWENVLYFISPNNNDIHSAYLQEHYPTRLAVLKGTATIYGKCFAPRIIGGTLQNERLPTTWLFASFGAVCLLAIIVVTVIALIPFFRRNTVLVSIQRLAALPLIFATLTALVFCFSSITALGLLKSCTIDTVGRYAAPLLLAIPFIIAAALTGIYLYFEQKIERQEDTAQMTEGLQARVRTSSPRSLLVVQGLLAVVLLAYLSIHAFTYGQAKSENAFQSFACFVAPLNNEPIIAYMQKQHITRAWSTMWIGNSITFKTQQKIVTADPRVITVHGSNRIPAFTSAVSHADRPSVLAFTLSGDNPPEILKALDADHVSYRVARFPAENGLDVLVITPLNRSLTPDEGNSLGSWYYGC